MENLNKMKTDSNSKDNINNKQSDTCEETVTYRDGFSFVFLDGDYTIRIQCSAKSGKEQVYVNDELITEKRSFRFLSKMPFELNDDHYEAELAVKNVFSGETHCTLIKNNIHIKTLKKALAPQNQMTRKNAKWFIPLCFLTGAISGYVAMTLGLKFFG